MTTSYYTCFLSEEFQNYCAVCCKNSILSYAEFKQLFRSQLQSYASFQNLFLISFIRYSVLPHETRSKTNNKNEKGEFHHSHKLLIKRRIKPSVGSFLFNADITNMNQGEDLYESIQTNEEKIIINSEKTSPKKNQE